MFLPVGAALSADITMCFSKLQTVFVHIAKCICNALRTVKFECFCQLGAGVSGDKLSALCCFHHSRQPSKKSRPAINNDHLYAAPEPPSMHFRCVFAFTEICQLFNVHHPKIHQPRTFVRTSSCTELRKELLSELANLET